MKAKFLRRVAVAMSMVVLVSTCAGCGAKDTTKESDTKTEADSEEDKGEDVKEEVKEEVTLSMTLIQDRDYPGLLKMIEKLEVEENIIIDLQIIPSDEYDNAMQMKINSGEAPDLMDVNTNSLAVFNPDNNLMDMSGESWTEKLISPQIAQYNGKTVVFPFQDRNGVGSIIYNIDVFEENGVAVPTTQEEFYAACETFKEKGITALLEASDLWVPQMWMNYEFPKALGGEEELIAFGKAITTHEKEVTDYPELAAVIDMYIDMFDKGYVNEDYLTSTYDKLLERLGNGEGAMVYGYSGVLGSVETKFPEGNFGTFNLQADTQAKDLLSSPFFSIGFAVPSTTEKYDTIQRVFELWSTPEYCDMWFEENAGFPAFEGVNGGEQNPSQQAMYEEYVANDALVSEFLTVIPELNPINNTSLFVYLMDAPGKGMTGMEVLEKWQEDINVFMKELQAPGF